MYAEIVAEESSTNYKQDFIAMFLKKKVEAQWPRILSTLNKVKSITDFKCYSKFLLNSYFHFKPKFLKSVYDNITGALDEDGKSLIKPLNYNRYNYLVFK